MTDGIQLTDAPRETFSGNPILDLTRFPKPYFQVKGRRVLVYQSENDVELSKIIAMPDTVKDARRPSVGTIIQVGDGYVPIAWTREEREEWKRELPYSIGDRIMWSRYEALHVECYVHPSWWEGRTEIVTERKADGSHEQLEVSAIEAMRRNQRERKVRFVIVPVEKIEGVVTAPRRRVFE